MLTGIKMCTALLLQPRSFTFKKKQKNRSTLFFKKKNILSNSILQFGGAGLYLLQPAQLTANQIYRFRLFLKRASRKSDKTRRFV